MKIIVSEGKSRPKPLNECPSGVYRIVTNGIDNQYGIIWWHNISDGGPHSRTVWIKYDGEITSLSSDFYNSSRFLVMPFTGTITVE